MEKSKCQQLYQQARNILKLKGEKPCNSSENNIYKLYHELQIKQIEFELINSELELTNKELELTNKELERNNKIQIKINEISVANENLTSIKNALHETNEYLENLIDYAIGPIVIWDSQFRITRFNHSFELLTGLLEKDLLLKPLIVLFPPVLIINIMSQVCENLSENYLNPREINIKCADKSIKTILWSSFTLFESDKKTPIAFVAQCQDITERIKNENLLKDNMYHYQSLLNATPYAIIIHQNLKIVYVNSVAIKMFGATSENELVGTNTINRLHSDHHQLVYDHINDKIEDNFISPPKKLKYIKLDGAIIYGEATRTMIIYEGVPSVYVAILVEPNK